MCAVRRAMVLTLTGRADIVESGPVGLRGAEGKIYDTPSVIRLQNYVKRPLPKPRLTRKEIFIRDGYKCQYCGIEAELSQLTIDHVIPKQKGGIDTWDNLVTACSQCNTNKGNSFLKETKMSLIRMPKKPNYLIYLQCYVKDSYKSWKPYLYMK